MHVCEPGWGWEAVWKAAHKILSMVERVLIVNLTPLTPFPVVELKLRTLHMVDKAFYHRTAFQQV